MLKTEHIETCGWKAALRGMRNAMNSWAKSDSGTVAEYAFDQEVIDKPMVIGPNDMKLAKTLINAGTPDRKFLRMIHIQMDIIAPLYWWKEYDTYKVATTANSCSTMHKIHSRELTMDDFSYEHLNDANKLWLEDIIGQINGAREFYLENGDKEDWWQMIQLLPSSYNQRRTVDLNYETAMQIWRQRHYHKLDEWHTLCDTILDLPYMRGFMDAI